MGPKRLVVLILLLAALAAGQAKPDFTGKWAVDVTDSNFGMFPPPKRVTSTIDHKDPVLRVSSRTKAVDGTEDTAEFTYSTDGIETTNHIAGFEVKNKAYWQGAALIVETRAATEAGDIRIRDRWTLSDDGQILTVEREWSGPAGNTHQRIIHNKLKG